MTKLSILTGPSSNEASSMDVNVDGIPSPIFFGIRRRIEKGGWFR
jgi:hypothetical protein